MQLSYFFIVILFNQSSAVSKHPPLAVLMKCWDGEGGDSVHCQYQTSASVVSAVAGLLFLITPCIVRTQTRERCIYIFWLVTPLISHVCRGPYYLRKFAGVNNKLTLLCKWAMLFPSCECLAFLPLPPSSSPASSLWLSNPYVARIHTDGVAQHPRSHVSWGVRRLKALPRRFACALSLAPPQHISPDRWCSVGQISGWISTCNLTIDKFIPFLNRTADLWHRVQKNTCQKFTT